METITGQETGSAFIGKLNRNFAECSTVGTDGNVSVSVPLQGGDLKTATGYVDGRLCTAASTPVWTDDNFYKYLHTPCYLSLKGNKVKGITVPTGSTLSVFCYDDAFSLLSGGVVNDEDNIPESTAYVKMQLYNPNGYAQVLALDMVLAAAPEWVKNTGVAYSMQWFNYDCHPPKLWDDANYTTLHQMPTDGTADVDNTRYHDNGCVILPPNYSPTGKPCKVVMWLNGDNCAWFINHGIDTANVYSDNFKFLNACGYAVVMCSGYTSMWKGEDGSTNVGWWNSRITPAYIASIRAFYDRIMTNYNFDPQVYIGAKSAGGSMLLHTALTRPFPIRAAAGMSVIVSVIDTIRFSVAKSNKSWHKMFGCVNWNSFSLSNVHGKTGTKIYNGSGATSTQTANANLILANKDKYRLLEPFTMNSDIDFDAFVAQVLAISEPFNDGADYPSALTDVIFAAHKVCTTPIKYWCATKDEAVPYTWHKIMAEWINRNGGIAELRSYTGSDGDHYTFAGNGNKTATVSTPFGGSRTASIGFIEAVEWFKRW